MQRRDRERRELEQLAQERMQLAQQAQAQQAPAPAPVPQPQAPQDPSVWQKYLWDRDPESKFFPGLGTELGQIASLPPVEWALSKIGAVHEGVAKPFAGEIARTIPVTREDTGTGLNWDAFEQYVDPEFPGISGRRGIRANPILDNPILRAFAAPLAEWTDKPILPRTDTVREQRISEEAARKEVETGIPATQRERREISQDLYKLPPGVLGTLEELPWFALPEARAVQGLSRAARTGQALSTTGRLGRAAPVARGTLRATELALTPIARMEQALAATIKAPFQLAGAAGRGARSALLSTPVLNRRQVSVLSGRILKLANDMIDGLEVGGETQTFTPAQAVGLSNNVFHRFTGIRSQFRIQDGRAALNPNAIVPDRVRVREVGDVAAEVLAEPDVRVAPEPVTARRAIMGGDVPEGEVIPFTPPEPRPTVLEIGSPAHREAANTIRRSQMEEGYYRRDENGVIRFPPLKEGRGTLVTVSDNQDLVTGLTPHEAAEYADNYLRDNPSEPVLRYVGDDNHTVILSPPDMRVRIDSQSPASPTFGVAPPYETHSLGVSGSTHGHRADNFYKAALARGDISESGGALRWANTPQGKEVLRQRDEIAEEWISYFGESPHVSRITFGNGIWKETPSAAVVPETRLTDEELVTRVAGDIETTRIRENEELIERVVAEIDPARLNDEALISRLVQEIDPAPLTDEQLLTRVSESIGPAVRAVEPPPGTQIARAIPPARAAEAAITGVGPTEAAVPSVQEFQPSSFIERRRERGDAGHAAIEEGAASGIPQTNTTKSGMDAPSVIARNIKDRFPFSADTYVKMMFSWWDSTFGLRLLQDNYFRSKHPGAIFRAGSKEDVISGIVLSAGAPLRGAARYTNFIRYDIEPILAKGITQAHIERYLQFKHWPFIEEGARLQKKKLPDIIDPVTGERTSSENLLKWDDELRAEYTKEQYDALVEGAEKARDLYSEMRMRLRDAGIISPKVHDELAAKYPWYNPIEYIEFADAEARGLSSTNRFSVESDGIYAYSENPEVMGALPPLGDTMLRKLIQTELRITRNDVTKNVVRMGIAEEVGLKDLSDKFIRKALPYDEEAASGYFSFYEGGERMVYGAADGGPVPKWLWDAVNGRSGLSTRGVTETHRILAATNGYFRSIHTTYNPLFFTRNALIDSYTVMLRAGIGPHRSIIRIIQSLYKAAINGEDRLAEMSQYMGGYQARYFEVNAAYKRIQRELQEAGHVDNARVIDDPTGKKLDKALRDSVRDGTLRNFGRKLRRAIPATGEAIEQAPRLKVFEKSLKKLIGKQEYNRLMKLSREDFQREMLDSWVPRFDVDGSVIDNPQSRGFGFADSPEGRHAAHNGIEATINFGRGGDQVRYANNYFLFLNAAAEGFKLPSRALGINLHPEIRPVRNPVRGGPQFEWGSISEQVKNYVPSSRWLPEGIRGTPKGVTSKYMDVGTGGPMAAAFRISMAMMTYWTLLNYWNKREKFNGVALYYDVPKYIRYNAIVFMLPAERDEAGDYILDPRTNRPTPRYIVVPHKFREWNMLMQNVTLLGEITDEEVPFDKSQFAMEIFKSTSPISDIPAPELIKAALEEGFAYDTWRQAPIVDPDLEGRELEEQYIPTTSETARKMAGLGEYAAENIPMPEFVDNIIGSPQRVDHLYESIGGGAGRLVTSVTDSVMHIIDDLWKLNDRPMEQKVADYREMDRVSRNEFRTALTEEEYEEFDRELRMPRKEIPFWDAMLSSFAPARGGGLRETARAETERLFGGQVSEEEVRNAGRTTSRVRQALTIEQVENDNKLENWTNGARTNVLSPSEWRAKKSEKWAKFEGAELAISKIYHRSIQNQPPEVRDAYYDSLYTAAGKMEDMRVGVDLLLAGYYAIEPVSDDPDNIEWGNFFEARREYVENIRISSEAARDMTHADFMRALSANDTPREKAYDESRDIMGPYWDIGRDINQLAPNATQTMPQIAQKWNEYLSLDRGRKQQMYDSDRQIQTLVKRRSDLRKQHVIQSAQTEGYPYLDMALVFWYGDFYQPVTDIGKRYHNRMYRTGEGGYMPHQPSGTR